MGRCGESQARLVILGLDASTTVCGWCILSADGSVLNAGHIDFHSGDDLYQRLRHLRRGLAEVIARPTDVTHVFIEEPKKMFGGQSTAHVMSLLQRFNGMVSAMLSIDLVDPVLINERTARKQLGIQIPHKCKKNETKLLVGEHVKASEALPASIWEYKRTGKLKDHCLDIADAYVVAHAGYLSATSTIS